MHGARGGAPLKYGLYTKEAKAFMKEVNALVAESRSLTKDL